MSEIKVAKGQSADAIQEYNEANNDWTERYDSRLGRYVSQTEAEGNDYVDDPKDSGLWLAVMESENVDYQPDQKGEKK